MRICIWYYHHCRRALILLTSRTCL